MFNRNRTYKDIEDSRNTRLWITEVILPATGMALFALSNENITRELKKGVFKVRTKTTEIGHNIKNIFSKEEKEES